MSLLRDAHSAMANNEIDLDEYNGGSLVATATVFLALSWISVLLRTYTRTVLMKSFKLDDWLMLIAQIIFTLSCSFILLGARVGLGRHNAAITNKDDEVEAIMWQALATATYIIDMMFIKMSIGFFLLRMSVQRVYTIILQTSIVIIFIWSTVTFFWDIFQCNPVQKQWDYRIKEGTCVSAQQIVAAAYAISVMTIVSDWLYALLPIPMLWKVKMTKQAKATVIVILGLGVFASIATLIRIKFLTDLEVLDDILFSGTDAMVWTLVEPGVAIVASSLATIRPLLRAMKISGFESTDRGYGTGRSTGMRSAGTRPQLGVMPGHGPNDVSLENFEPNYESKPQLVATKNSVVLQQYPQSSHPDRGEQTNGMGTSKSEVFVIEGNTTYPDPASWNTDNHSIGSSHPSFDQIHDLEAQSQDTRGFGLGDGRR